MKPKTTKGKQVKKIIFCHICNRIVGTEFPIFDHSHGLELHDKLLMRKENLQYLGYRVYKDTKKTRETLTKKFPPRDEIVIKL